MPTERETELEEALQIATTQMRDLLMGYSVRDLCEPPATTFERLTKLVPNHEVAPL